MSDFDEILKNKFENFRVETPDNALANIQRHYAKGGSVFSNYKYYFVAGISAVAVIATIVVLSIVGNNFPEPQNNQPVLAITPQVQDSYAENTQIVPEPVQADIVETPKSVIKLDGHNIDTIVCGTEVVLPNISRSKIIKSSKGLEITDFDSSVRLHGIAGETYSITYLSYKSENTLTVTFKSVNIPQVIFSDDDLCYGEKLLVSVSNDSNINWNDDEYKLLKLDDKYEISSLHQGLNNVVITGSDGQCSWKVSKQIKQEPALKISTTSTDNYCSHNNATLTLNTSTAINFTSLNDTIFNKTGKYTALSSGIYYVKVNYGNNCEYRDTILIKDKMNLNSYFVSSKNTFSDNVYDFRNETRIEDGACSIGDGVDFYWYVDGDLKSTDYNFNYEFANQGKYKVELLAEAASDCRSRYSENITVLVSGFKIPNIFTPNGDGISDEFKISYEGSLQDYEIKVLTRSGQLIFESNDINNSWDGKIRGNNDASEGVYFYTISARDTKNEQIIEKGTVQLIRR